MLIELHSYLPSGAEHHTRDTAPIYWTTRTETIRGYNNPAAYCVFPFNWNINRNTRKVHPLEPEGTTDPRRVVPALSEDDTTQ